MNIDSHASYQHQEQQQQKCQQTTSAGNMAKSTSTSSRLNSVLAVDKRRLLTIVYCVVFWNFGLCVSLFGPTLIDLACQTSSTLSAMSLLYFMQNATSLIGCFVSGLIVKRNL